MIEIIALHFLKVILFLFLFIFFPGLILSRKLKLPSWIDLQLAIGLGLFLPTLFLGRWIFSYKLFLILYLLLFVLLAKIWKIKFNLNFPKLDKVAVIIILFGLVAQAWSYIAPLLSSLKSIYYEIYANHDQSWHAALINELVHSFPPQTPGFANTVLKNYHYFYDLLIAGNISIFGGDITIYLQVVYPIMISLFFGISVYRFSTLITDNKYLSYLAVFLAYFGNNLSYVFHWFGHEIWQSDSLLLDQPLIFLYNHQTVLSITLLLYIFIVADLWFKNNFKVSLGLVLAVMIVGLFNLKIYAFVIAVLTIGILTLIQLIKLVKKKEKLIKTIYKILPILALGLSICGIIYKLNFQNGKTFLNFTPGWILEEFFIRNLLPIWKELASRMAMYKLFNQHFKIILLDIFIAFIYLISNLNIRLLGLFRLGSQKIIIQTLIISSLIPLFFILFTSQNISPFNIIQFGPYAIIGLTLLTISFLDKIKNKKYLLLSKILILTVSLPTSIKTISNFRIPSYNDVNTPLLDALQVLQNYPFGTVVAIDSNMKFFGMYPGRDIYRGNNIAGSVALKRTYFFDKDQLEVLQIDYQQRAKFIDYISENICNLSKEDKNKIKQEKIDYLILPTGKKCADLNLIYNSPKYVIYSI